MDLTDTGTTVTVIAGVAILAGVLGVVIPVLPGLLLCWLGVLLWALLGDAGGGRLGGAGVATVVAIGGTVVKYLWPGQAAEEHRGAHLVAAGRRGARA